MERDARHELLRVERFHDVVIRPRLEPHYLFSSRVAAGEKNDRNLPCPGIPLQQPADIIAIHPRQVDIQQDQIRTGFHSRGHCSRAVFFQGNLILPSEDVQQLGLRHLAVFNGEYLLHITSPKTRLIPAMVCLSPAVRLNSEAAQGLPAFYRLSRPLPPTLLLSRSHSSSNAVLSSFSSTGLPSSW